MNVSCRCNMLPHQSCLKADTEGSDHVVDTQTIEVIPQQGDGENGPAYPINEEEGSEHEGEERAKKPLDR